MRKLKVLVACEESQEVCKAFRELGHIAFSCDLQECSGGHPEWHIQGDVLNFLEPYDTGSEYAMTFYTQNGAWHEWYAQWYRDAWWDLIIAHPPCTYMSAAGACRMYPTAGHIDENRLAKAHDAKKFFMRFLTVDCKRICIENPRPLKIVGLPKETQQIHPYQFGEPWSKLTYLWLKGLPNLTPTEVLSEHNPFLPSGTGRKLRGASYGAKGCGHDGKARSKTFPGIAKAMAEQWSAYILNEDGDNNG